MAYSVSIAALSVLPPQSRQTVQDRRREVKRSTGLDLSQIRLLDALAAVCVRDPGDAFATALKLSLPTASLFVASSKTIGVLPQALQRLNAVWTFLTTLAVQRNAAPSSHRDEQIADTFVDFVADQYRYSWPALRTLFQSECQSVVGALSKVAEHKFNPSELARLQEWHRRERTPEVKGFLREIVNRLTTASASAFKMQMHDSQALFSLHAELIDLKTCVRVALQDATSQPILSDVEEMTDVPVRFYLRQLLWLADVPDDLARLASSAAFKSWSHLKLDVIAVPATQHRVPLDLNNEAELRANAKSAYADFVPRYRISPDFEDDWRTHILEPIVAQTEHSASPDETVDLDVQLHAECALVEYLYATGQQPLAYLGTSEQSCLSCWTFLRAHNAVLSTEFYVQGHHGGTPLRWAAPALPGDSAGQVERRMIGALREAFVRGLEYMRWSWERQRSAGTSIQ